MKFQKKLQKQAPKSLGKNIDPLALLAALGLKGVGKGPGKGQGKGQGKASGKDYGVKKPVNKFAEKLRQVDAEKKVWVGGLSKTTTWKQVEKHFEGVMKPKICDVTVRRDGTATATLAYASAGDVAAVVEALNGSELNGKTIEVDVWQKGTYEKSDKTEKKAPQEKKKKKKIAQNPLATQGLMKVLASKITKAKAAPAKKADNKIAEKLRTIDASLKVWVGGLSPNTTWKTLQQHFSTVAKPQVVEIMKKGKGVVAYKNADDVATAIATLNGSELEGATLEVDVWVKPERTEKKKKTSE